VNDLTEAMRCATDSPPPTRIDVDGLLRTHRGRRATQWMAATGGALVLAVTAVTAVGAIGSGRPAAGPAASPAASLVDPHPGVADKLTAAWRAALARSLGVADNSEGIGHGDLHGESTGQLRQALDAR